MDVLPPAFAPGQRTQFLLTARGQTLASPPQTLLFDLETHRADSTQTVRDQPVVTNVVWSPLVQFEGARMIGRDRDGRAVIVIPAGTGDVVSANSAHPWPVWIGRVLSVLGVLGALWLLVPAMRIRRDRTRPSRRSATTDED